MVREPDSADPSLSQVARRLWATRPAAAATDSESEATHDGLIKPARIKGGSEASG